MPSTSTDRRNGLTTSVAIKAPCRVATVANITLFGEQTINGVAVVEGDRVLVMEQTDAIENGIYVVSESAWARSKDFDGNLDAVQGTIVLVRPASDGTLFYELQTANPVVIGTSEIEFSPADPGVETLITRLANPDDEDDGDAMIAAKRTRLSTAIDSTLHDWIEGAVVHLKENGVVADGVTDDSTALQAVIDALSLLGGGRLVAEYGKTIKCNTPPIVKNYVTLDLNQGWLYMTPTGNEAVVATQYGARLRNHAWIINGKVTNEPAGGNFGSQAGICAAINMGALQGEAGTVASPTDDAYVTGCGIRNLRGLKTTRDGKAVVCVLGAVDNFTIENNVFDASATARTAVQIELGYLGNMNSLTIAADRVLFDAGTGLTLHPSNGLVRGNKAGSFSRPYGGEDDGGHFIRVICAGYNILVENNVAQQTTYAFIRHTVNGMGYEFADATLKPMLGQNIVFRNNTCFNNRWLINHDGFANQVDQAAAYSPLRDPLAPVGVVYENNAGVGNLASNISGILVQKTRGGIFRNNSVSGFYDGIELGERCYDVLVEGGQAFANGRHGALISSAISPPEDCTIRGLKAYGNGVSDAAAGIQLDGCIRPTIEMCRLGTESTAVGVTTKVEATQDNGIACTNSTYAARILNNHGISVATGGVMYKIGTNDTDYHCVELFQGNTWEGHIPTAEIYSGVRYLPVSSEISPASIYKARRFRAIGTAAPSAGTWVRGDIIEYEPAASTAAGTRCVTSGTFSAFTDSTGDTTNGSNIITGLTSTTGLSVGDFVTLSAGFASTGPHRVLAKTSTTITVSSSSNSSQSNITVSTPDPVFKAMAALAA